MIEVQEMRNTIAEQNKRRKEINDKLNQAIEKVEKTRQVQEDESTR